MFFPESELVINSDGSIYHLHLKPEHVATTVITVGDPNRVGEVSKHFDKIEHKASHREFVTHTGQLRGKRLTVISTGIGTDNIDIVINELDALVNIDLEKRESRNEHTSLNFVRIGTSGSLQQDIPIGSYLISSMAIGFDNLMHFYEAQNTGEEIMLADALTDYLEQKSGDLILIPYAFSADKNLVDLFSNHNFAQGITVTTSGFYAPQGRKLRGRNTEVHLVRLLNSFKHRGKILTNFEMETAGIYGLARLLGHRAISISAILANRIDNTFSKEPQKEIEGLIEKVLDILTV